ncbi:MAG: N-acetyltransferase [Hyphomicrobiaceae bacterium]
MPTSIDIRASAPHDLASIEALYADAFPDEDLIPLIRELLDAPSDVLSLVAERDGQTVGHLCLTSATIEGCRQDAALLGPLAVASAAQRQGIGAALVRDGVSRLAEQGVDWLCVLGDPAYYGRFGFVADTAIEPPYPLAAQWRSAWQSLPLRPSSQIPRGSRLVLPALWMRPSLWAP